MTETMTLIDDVRLVAADKATTREKIQSAVYLWSSERNWTFSVENDLRPLIEAVHAALTPAPKACRACGSTLTRKELDDLGAINCCPERGVNEVIEQRHGIPALIDPLALDAARYRYLRDRDAGPDGSPPPAGLFIGRVPQNLILTGEDADTAIDAAMGSETEKEA